jgi:disulfide oxidoreductase YuzD
LYKDDGGIIWTAYNQQGAVQVYNVLKNTYDLKLRQGPKVLDVANINCTGETGAAGDVTAQLTVDLSGTWLSGINVELYKDDGGIIWTAYNQQGAVQVYNVLKNTYDLKLRQGPKVLDVANINCTGETGAAGDVTAQLTVDLSGTWLSGINVELHLDDGLAGSAGSIIWTAYNQQGAVRVYNVLKNTYDVVLQYGGKTYIWDAVNCTGETCTLDKSTLTVDFPGISSVHVYVYRSDGVAGTVSGTLIASQTYKNDQAVFPSLTNGKYDVKVVKNAKVLIVDDVIVLGNNANAGDIVCTLTVKFPGISSVHTYVKVDDGKSPESATGGDVENRTYQNNETSMAVLKNTYDVVVVKGAKTKIIDAVNCNGDTAVVENIVCTLTVKFPGISSVHTYVKVDDGKSPESATGGDVENRTYQNNEASMVVLKNTYDVVVVKGAKTKIIDAVNCNGDTAVVENIVCTLTVKFPGISSVHTYVKVNDGVAGTATFGDVDNRTYQNNETSMVVLKNTYDLVLVKGAKIKIIDAVNCTGDTALVENIVCVLTIKFPGFSNVHTYVKLVDGIAGQATGGDVDNRTYKTNEVSLAVLRNHYDIKLVMGGGTGVADNVDCTGATCTLAGSNLQINAPAGTTVQIKHYTSGAVIATGTVAGNQWVTFSNLPIGIYDIVLTQGANTVTIQDRFHFAGTTIDMLNVLQVNAPAGTQVQVLKGGNLVTSGTVAGNQWVTLYVVKDTYDLRLTQNAEVKNVAGVNCTSENTSVDQLSVLTVNAPAGTKVNVYVPNTINLVTSGTVAGNQWVTLYVVRDTYDVYLEQNTAGTETVEDVDVDADTSIDRLCILKVNAPASTAVQVLKGGNLVTSGTVAGNQWVELYVVKGSYDLKLTQGAEVKAVGGLDCSGDNVSTDQLAELKVNAPANTFVEVLTSGTLVTSGTVAGNQWVTLYVVKDTYDLRLTQNAEVKSVTSVDCTGDSKTEDQLSMLRVNAPAGTSVKVFLPGFTSEVTSGTVAGNQWVTLYVVSDKYDVYLEQNAEKKTVEDVVITSDTDLSQLCTLQVKDTPGTLIKVFLPGFTSEVTSGTVAGNQWVTLYVVRDTYDVNDGTTTKSAVCSGATQTVTFP